MSKRQKTSNLVWGLIGGLTTFALASLIGIIAGVAPFNITKRALIAALIMGVVTRVAAQVISLNLVIKS